jgi:hypothetical protein
LCGRCGTLLQRGLAVIGAVANWIVHGSGRPWWLTVLNTAASGVAGLLQIEKRPTSL